MQCHLLSLLNFTEDFTITTAEQQIITVPTAEIQRQSLLNVALNSTFHFYIDRF
jgi:hypothetical protein